MKEETNKPMTWEDIARIAGEETANYLKAKSELNRGLNFYTEWYHKLSALRKYYQSQMDGILKTFEKSRFLWHASYPYDWSLIHTPIEQRAWEIIRGKGRIILYPQFPVLNFMVDFANPGLKVGLELDGKEFHDRDRDLRRDEKLREPGWTIYRVTGSEINNNNFKDFSDFNSDGIEDPDDQIRHIHEWLLNTGDGVIEAIKMVHFEHELRERYYDSEVGERFVTYCYKTLEHHQLF